MASRPRVTISLSQDVIDWLREQVKEGKEASVGWVIEKMALAKMKKRARKCPKGKESNGKRREAIKYPG
jgi:Arc/MetJ-type ribon-helix-helix transcriptional regulator